MKARAWCMALTLCSLLVIAMGILGLQGTGWHTGAWYWIGLIIAGFWLFGASEIWAGILYARRRDNGR